MKNRLFIFGMTLLLVMAGCKEITLLHPFGDDDGVAPGPVSNVKVRNFSGGATLSYTLPQDEDLSYVLATFTGTNGEARQAKASGYSDSLVLEGFGDTKAYEVELRAYDKFENASEPVKVKINPLTPPIQKVFESLKYTIDFGGFVVTFDNPDKADIGIYITRRDPNTKEMEFYDVYFTEQSSGKYSVRGLPDEENDFGIYVQDYWNNTSKTLTFTDTPWREDELDNTKYVTVDPSGIIGDLQAKDIHHPWSNIYDGVIDCWNYGHTKWPVAFPHRFTIDLGVIVKLSRMKEWQRNCDDTRWQHGGWRIFNVYGCTEILPYSEQSASDPLKGWTLIGAFESIKPSGLPIGSVSDEDMQLLIDGEEFSFDRDAPAVRYIRFEVLKVHSESLFSCLSEIKLWGQIENDDPDGPNESNVNDKKD